MKEHFIHIKRIKIISILALFNFLFLGTEFLFDNMMAYVTDSEHVVMAQNYVLGASVLGFVMFPVLAQIIGSRKKYINLYIVTVVSVICLFLIQQHNSYVSIMAAGCVIFAIIGIAGSGVHYMAVRLLRRTAYLGRTVGLAYAVGLLLQFLNNNLVNDDTVEAVVLSLFIVIWAVIVIKLAEEKPVGEKSETIDAEPAREDGVESRYSIIPGIVMLFIVVLMTCIFSTLDNVVTLFHAEGSVDVGQWPRLFLAMSGLVAGLLFDIKQHKYMHIIMYCVTLLSVVCVLVIVSGGPILVGLLVFYVSAGFFVVFFTTGFMDLSYKMRVPQFWAGIGRAANNLCAMLLSPVSLMIVKTQDSILISILALIIFVLLSITMFVYSAISINKSEQRTELYGEEKEAAKFQKFAECYKLTQREQEVLKVLLVSDESAQDVAEQLYMSRAALYRHITALNEKTATNTRIGLIQYYYSWKDN